VRDRARNQSVLAEILTEIFRTRDAGQWLEEFDRAGVPASLINSYSEAVADPQVTASGWVQPMTLPSGAPTRTFASPLRFDGSLIPVRTRPPLLDENRSEIIELINGQTAV
jgi:crotonobetainyl-CoA:carnitine CoA-transferase CaiB-like acyl-CoA transferase